MSSWFCRDSPVLQRRGSRARLSAFKERELACGEHGRLYVFEGRSSHGTTTWVKKEARSIMHDVGNLRTECEVYCRLNSLNVPNFCRMVSYSTEFKYIVLEKLSRSPHREGRRRWRENRFVFCMAAQIVEALRILHQQRYVHNDICPENILLRSDQNCHVLADFSMATSCGSRVPKAIMQGKSNFKLASNNLLKRGRMYPADDIESLFYLVAFLYNGSLPWGNHTGRKEVLRQRENTRTSDFIPSALLWIYRASKQWAREAPEYNCLIEALMRAANH